MKDYLSETPINYNDLLRNEQLQFKVNQKMINMIDPDYQIKKAKGFFLNKEYQYFHSSIVKEYIEKNKALLLAAEEWTPEFEKLYKTAYKEISGKNDILFEM